MSPQQADGEYLRLNNDYSSSETADASSNSDFVNNENPEELCGKSDKYLTKEAKNLIDQLKKPILQRLNCYTEAYYAGFECAKNTNQTVLKNFQIDDQVCACERQIMENQCDKTFSEAINQINQKECGTDIVTIKRDTANDNVCPSVILDESLNKGNTDPDHDGLKTIVEFLLRNNICGNTYTCDSSDGNLDKNGNGIPDGRDRSLAEANPNEIKQMLADPDVLASTYGVRLP